MTTTTTQISSTERHYYQLGRSQLLHIVDHDAEADLTLCGRDIYETGKLADDVDDAPLCTHCLRKFRKARA